MKNDLLREAVIWQVYMPMYPVNLVWGIYKSLLPFSIIYQLLRKAG